MGVGNYDDEINDNWNCIKYESNTIWYTFTVNQSGDFGFVLVPNNLDDDYDWVLFNITNAACDDLNDDPSLIVSCNAAGGLSCHGPTGATGDSEYNNQGFGCSTLPPTIAGGYSPFNDLVPVIAGNTYVLCVSNWTGSTNGYTIDFGLSTGIGIFDEEKPEVEFVELPDECLDDTVRLRFSENIQCPTINSDNFILEGPGGSYAVVLSSAICDLGGSYDKEFLVTFDPPIHELGIYTFTLQTDGVTNVLDLCNNPASTFSTTFSIDEIAAFDINIGLDTSICPGDSLQLNVSSPTVNYLWQDGNNAANYSIDSGGLYSVTIHNGCGSGSDTLIVTMLNKLAKLELGNDTILCPGEMISLNAELEHATQYLWHNNSTSSSLSVLESGTYAVSVSGECGIQTDEINIRIIVPIETVLENGVFCEGETFLLNATTPDAVYQWQDGSGLSVYEVSQPGIYTVTVSTICESREFEVEMITEENTPIISLGSDTLLCIGDTLSLNAYFEGAAIEWQDGSDSDVFTVTEAGTYAVAVSNSCGEDQDAIEVGFHESVHFDLGNDTFLCEGERLYLDISDSNASNYIWSDGSTIPFLSITEPDKYSVQASNECETIEDDIFIAECEVCEVYLPSAFSPNGDGFNDIFLPFSDCPLEEYSLKIFNRWGSILFESPSSDKGWEGNYNGKQAPIAVYAYLLNYTVVENGRARMIQHSGDVLVIR